MKRHTAISAIRLAIACSLLLLLGLAGSVPLATATAAGEANGQPAQNAVISAEQQRILDEFGRPESFRLVFATEGGDQERTASRIEEWNYYRLQTRLSFVDGALQGGGEIEDVPDWTLLPMAYRPEQFTGLMGLEEIQRSVTGERPFERLEVPDDLLPGARLEMIGFEQLVLGFEQGRLIYVETVPLFPNAAETGREGEERQ